MTGDGFCPDLSGECYVSFWSRAITTPNYFVLDTDYTSYSIVYNCSPNDMQYLWFLTRDNVINDELYKKMMKKATAALPNFDFRNLDVRTYQGKKCKYEEPTFASQFL